MSAPLHLVTAANVEASWIAAMRAAIARGEQDSGVPYRVRGRGDRIEVFHPSLGQWGRLLPHFASEADRDEVIRQITTTS
jgi:hypothetical protein